MVRYSVGSISGLVFLGLWLQTQGDERHVCVTSGAMVIIYPTCESQGKLLSITGAYYRLSYNGCSTQEDDLLPCHGDMEALTQDVRTRCNRRPSCTYLFTYPATTDRDENLEGTIVMFIYFECYSPDSPAVHPTVASSSSTVVSSVNNGPEVITNASPTYSPTPYPGDSVASAKLPGSTSANPQDSSQQTLAPADGAVVSVNNTEQELPVWIVFVQLGVYLLFLLLLMVYMKLCNYMQKKRMSASHASGRHQLDKKTFKSDTTDVENGPVLDPNATQNGAVSTAKRYSTGEESPYGYDTPCVVNPDEAENMGHYVDPNDLTTDFTNQAQNNTRSQPSIEDVSLNYIYDDPCDVKLDEAGANEF